MSTSTLTRPTRRTPAPVRTATAAAAGSYVDTDGVRRTPRVLGSYTGTAASVGAYTGRRPSAVGSYVRSER